MFINIFLHFHIQMKILMARLIASPPQKQCHNKVAWLVHALQIDRLLCSPSTSAWTKRKRTHINPPENQTKWQEGQFPPPRSPRSVPCGAKFLTGVMTEDDPGSSTRLSDQKRVEASKQESSVTFAFPYPSWVPGPSPSVSIPSCFLHNSCSLHRCSAYKWQWIQWIRPTFAGQSTLPQTNIASSLGRDTMPTHSGGLFYLAKWDPKQRREQYGTVFKHPFAIYWCLPKIYYF